MGLSLDLQALHVMILRSFSKQIPKTARAIHPFQLRTMTSEPKKPIYFGKFEVTDQVFHTTPHTFCLVNIKPILPGHVLIIPFAPHSRLTSLSPLETSDLFQTVQRVQRMLAKLYFPEGEIEQGSFNVAIQDGPESGQTVPHVHCHVIPRTRESVAELGPDGVYDRLQGEGGNVGGGLWDREREREGEGERPVQRGRFPRVDEEERRPRSAEEMNKEAAWYRDQMRIMLEEEKARE
ncbi:Bis(5 -adenosyl)-triphosphatase protein [Rutstroemia sp. NJR-2017a BVV2]|nr:Bis(5 -adenosyl)-triphosphatase protein [Rutstroemia sp. NJR-2017a BVV2]